MTSSWCGKQTRHRNVAGGLDQVCALVHIESVYGVNMCGSLWKCSQLQCKLATTEDSRGLEIQNQLLDDMKAEFQEFPGRRVYTDVEREGSPPSDADKQPVCAPRYPRRGGQEFSTGTDVITSDIISSVSS